MRSNTDLRLEALEKRVKALSENMRDQKAYEIRLEGAGDPNGVVTAVQGTLYWDSTNQALYANTSVAGTPPEGTVWCLLPCAAGGSWIDETPDSITLTTGTYVSGAVADVQTMFDGNVYHVDEVVGVPGFDIRFNFTNVAIVPRCVVCRWIYAGSATHYVGIDLYNYTTTNWDTIHTFVTSGGYYRNATKMIPLVNTPNYVSAGAAIIRFYHYTTGNNSHDIQIDYVGLSSR